MSALSPMTGDMASFMRMLTDPNYQTVDPQSIMPQQQNTGATSVAMQGAASPYGPTANVQAPPKPEEYRKALQDSYAPMFKDQQDQLSARLAGTGTLTSGQGSRDLQDLTAKQSSTLASGMLPLLQQGFGQEYGANTTNANAKNSMNTLLTQGQMGIDQFNTGQVNTFSRDQMQNANSAYLQQLMQMGGLDQTALQGLQSLVNNGNQNAWNGYTDGTNMGFGVAKTIGQNNGYGYGPTGGGGYNPASPNTPGIINGIRGYSPYPGGNVTLQPGTGQGEDPNAPVNISGGDGTTPTGGDGYTPSDNWG